MRRIFFDQDEMTLLAIYQDKTKQDTVVALKKVLDEIKQVEQDETDQNMEVVMTSLIDKLQLASEQYFSSLSLQSYLNNIEEDIEHE